MFVTILNKCENLGNKNIKFNFIYIRSIQKRELL